MPTSVIIVFGAASNKLLCELNTAHADDSLVLMSFLRQNKIPVASSCYGEGVCNKCVVQINNSPTLSCQVRLSELIAQEINITIDYL